MIVVKNRSMVAGRPVRRLAELIHRHHLEDPLSQIAWIISVCVFARWTLAYYRAPAGGVPWIGMTIRTTVFALWAQVLREWLALRWWRPKPEQLDRDREKV